MALTRRIGQAPNLLIKNHQRQRGEHGGDAGAGEPERGLSGGESAERWDKLAVVVADGEFFGGDGVGRRRA